MSKAFTKEPDGDDDGDGDEGLSPLPRDFTNYITPGGFRRLHDELAQLWKV